MPHFGFYAAELIAIVRLALSLRYKESNFCTNALKTVVQDTWCKCDLCGIEIFFCFINALGIQFLVCLFFWRKWGSEMGG